MTTLQNLAIDPFDPDMSCKRRSEIVGGRCWSVNNLQTVGRILVARSADPSEDSDEMVRAAKEMLHFECDKNIADMERYHVAAVWYDRIVNFC